jgi:alpha-N-arabinofuranosidase
MGSASLDGKRLLLTATNPDLKAIREAEISVRGGTIKSVRATSLTATDIHAHNTFADPNRVEPKAAQSVQSSSIVIHRFPPASVTKLEIDLT